MSKWREKLVNWLGSDDRVVKKVEQLDQRQRELGHDITNLQMKLDPLKRLVEQLRDKQPSQEVEYDG